MTENLPWFLTWYCLLWGEYMQWPVISSTLRLRLRMLVSSRSPQHSVRGEALPELTSAAVMVWVTGTGVGSGSSTEAGTYCLVTSASVNAWNWF